MTNELKPCPFCGGDARMAYGALHKWIVCERCGASSVLRSLGGEAIESWNARAERTCGEWRGETYMTDSGFTETDAQLWCEHCDIPLEEDWRYCPKCGARVVE